MLIASEVLFILLLISISTYFLIKRKRSYNLPPGPNRLPILGNLHQLGSLPHLSLDRLSKKYGPLMFLQLGSVPTLVISSSDVVRDIIKTKDSIFSDRPDGLYAVNKFSYNCNDISFAPYGDSWKELRKIASLELLSSKRVQSFQSVREQEVEILIDTIAQSSGPINLSKLFLVFVNNIVSRVTFGKKYKSLEEGDEESNGKFDEVMHETQALLGEFVISDYCPWLKFLNKLNGFEAKVENNFKELDKLYDEVIADHLDRKRPESEQEDFVDVLLRIQKERTNNGVGLNNQHMKGVLSDMFCAGTDTSAVTLVWIMAELIRNPTAMKRAQDEVREYAKGKGKGKIEESDLSNFAYLKAIVQETFRLLPPVPLLVPRQTTEECMIKGYKIPARTRVFINATSIGMDPNCWENPEKFEPGRFLGTSLDFKPQQNFEMIPFGVGRRGCPGISFGMVIIELALANLLYRLDWKLPQGMSIDKLDMEQVFGLTVFKKTPLFLEASPWVASE